MLREELAIDARLVVEALQVCSRHEPHEIRVARAVPREHGAVTGALVAAVLSRALEAAPGRDVEFTADDGLHAGLYAAGVEIHAAEEVAVVGQRDRRKMKLLRPLDQSLEAGGAIEEAVLGMDVQVNEVGVLFHGSLDFLVRPRSGSARPIPTRSCWAAWKRRRRPRGSRP